jgi:PAS domain-containing protein
MRHFSLKKFSDGGDSKNEASGETRGRSYGSVAESTPASRRGHDSPVWWIVPSGVALIAVIAFGTAILVSNLRDRARANAQHALSTTAYIIAAHLEGTFQSVELAQRNAIERMQSFGIASSGDLDRLMSTLDAHLMLKDSVSGAPQLDALLLVDPSGKLVGSSRNWPIPDTSETGREYFRVLSSDDSVRLFLSEPARSRLAGAWTIYLARRLVGPNGDFTGIIVGLMELHHFEQFFGSISIGNDVAIALFRSDGILLARDPHVEAAIGKKGGEAALFEDTWSTPDCKNRLASLQALTHYPVVVSVSTTESAALAQWLQVTKIIIGAVGLTALSIGAFILFIVHKLMQGIRRSGERLRRKKLQLDTALNNMSQGLLLYDREDHVVLCNRRYMEIYGVPAEWWRAAAPGGS